MNDQNARTFGRAALWFVWVHFPAVVLHSIAHEVLSVRVTPAQLAFIVPVIVVAPLAAAFMSCRLGRAGAAVLAASMFASFAFGLYYHFVADTPDHVSHVAGLRPASWSAVFRITAYVLLVSELAGAAAASLALRARPFKRYAARTDF